MARMKRTLLERAQAQGIAYYAAINRKQQAAEESNLDVLEPLYERVVAELAAQGFTFEDLEAYHLMSSKEAS